MSCTPTKWRRAVKSCEASRDVKYYEIQYSIWYIYIYIHIYIHTCIPWFCIPTRLAMQPFFNAMLQWIEMSGVPTWNATGASGGNHSACLEDKNHPGWKDVKIIKHGVLLSAAMKWFTRFCMVWKTWLTNAWCIIMPSLWFTHVQIRRLRIIPKWSSDHEIYR